MLHERGFVHTGSTGTRYAILFIFIHRYLRAPPLIVHRPVRTSFFQRFHVPLVGASVTMREGFL